MNIVVITLRGAVNESYELPLDETKLKLGTTNLEIVKTYSDNFVEMLKDSTNSIMTLTTYCDEILIFQKKVLENCLIDIKIKRV